MGKVKFQVGNVWGTWHRREDTRRVGSARRRENAFPPANKSAISCQGLWNEKSENEAYPFLKTKMTVIRIPVRKSSAQDATWGQNPRRIFYAHGPLRPAAEIPLDGTAPCNIFIGKKYVNHGL